MATLAALQHHSMPSAPANYSANMYDKWLWVIHANNLNEFASCYEACGLYKGFERFLIETNRKSPASFMFWQVAIWFGTAAVSGFGKLTLTTCTQVFSVKITILLGQTLLSFFKQQIEMEAEGEASIEKMIQGGRVNSPAHQCFLPKQKDTLPVTAPCFLT